MKKVFLFIVLAIGTMAASAQTASLSQEGAAEIKWDATEIDYGTIQLNANGQREFRFTNVGKAPLVISGCKGTCGCTVPQCPTKPILPGQREVIKVSYDTKRLGAFDKGVVVVSNAKVTSETLKIKGTVVDPAAATTAPAGR